MNQTNERPSEPITTITDETRHEIKDILQKGGFPFRKGQDFIAAEIGDIISEEDVLGYPNDNILSALEGNIIKEVYVRTRIGLMLVYRETTRNERKDMNFPRSKMKITAKEALGIT